MEFNSEYERDCWTRYLQNDPTAQVQLFQMYRSLADHLANQMKRRMPAHVRVDDLQAAAMEGLWKSMQSYTLDKGVPFAQYARSRIRGAMLDELRRTDDMTRTQRVQYKQAQAAYTTQHMQQSQKVSLDDDERYEWIVDDTTLTPEEAAIQSSDITALNRALLKLSEQERLVLAMVFVEGLTLAETADVLSLSRSRVTTIHSAALKSLKGSMMAVRKREKVK